MKITDTEGVLARMARHTIKHPSGCLMLCYNDGSYRYSRPKILLFTDGKYRPVNAARFILEQQLERKIMVGYEALHSCNTEWCINSEHIYEGTQQDNGNDLRQKNLSQRETAYDKHCDLETRLIKFLLAIINPDIMEQGDFLP